MEGLDRFKFRRRTMIGCSHYEWCSIEDNFNRARQSGEYPATSERHSTLASLHTLHLLHMLCMEDHPHPSDVLPLTTDANTHVKSGEQVGTVGFDGRIPSIEVIHTDAVGLCDVLRSGQPLEDASTWSDVNTYVASVSRCDVVEFVTARHHTRLRWRWSDNSSTDA